MSYESRIPQVYLLDIESGRRELLGTFPAMTLAPRFSADGRSLIFSYTRKGIADLLHHGFVVPIDNAFDIIAFD